MEKFRDLLSSTFIYSNEDNFDEDFRRVLQIFFFFGFYRPTPSFKRAVYGSIVFLLCGVGYLYGLIDDVVVSWWKSDLQEIVTILPYTLFGISMVVQIVTVLANQSKITKMIKAAHSIHDGEDDAALISYRDKSIKVVKFYTNCLEFSLASLSLVGLCGFSAFTLIMPTPYDVYAEGLLFYPLMIVSIAHSYFVILNTVGTDLLHVLFMVRVVSNLKVLNNKLRRCTNNEASEENEKELIECIKYHPKIIDLARETQEVFSYFFISKVFGMIIILTSFLFTIMKINIREETTTFVVAVNGLCVALFQIGSLCFIGQLLTSKSHDLIETSYSCNWIDQKMSFKKALMIFRYACLKELKVGVVKFDFSHDSFFQLITYSYKFYSSVGQTLDKNEKTA